MSIRSLITNLLMGDEISRLQSAFTTMRKAYEVGPFQLPPEQLVAQLKEADPWTLQDLVLQMQYDIVGGIGAASYTDAERQRAIDESLRMFRYDVVTEFGIRLWTNFGFGETVRIVPDDESAAEVWNEFWTADRNAAMLGDDNIHTLSDSVLSQGEIFVIVYASTQDGLCTMRVLGNLSNPGAKQITQIVTRDGDENTPLYYKREWIDDKGVAQSLYYADWQAFFSGEYEKAKLPDGARRAEDAIAGTTVVMLQIAHNRKGGARGWPLMTAGVPWARSHKKFREDRASVAAALAMYIQKIKAKGGQRAVDAIRDRVASSFQTGSASSLSAYDRNPPATAGSTWIENEAATMERLPMGSGAGDAKTDGDALLQMAGLGAGLYPVWLGNGDTNALASATSMERPMQRQFSRYQTFWAAQWRKLVRIVLGMAAAYGGKTFSTITAEVSTDNLVQTDLAGIVNAIAPLIAQTSAAMEKGFVDDAPMSEILSAVWVLAMDALQIQDLEKLTPQAFGAAPGGAPTTPTSIATEVAESHDAIMVRHICPLCEGDQAIAYPDHKGLLVCASCGRTYDPEVE